MLHLILQSRDCAFNLACEEWLLRSLPPGHPGYFLLWQNDPVLVIGRYQCAQEEINGVLARESGIETRRRITGGGAVYHDHGNLNFSFIQWLDKGESSGFSSCLEPVCAFVRSFGLPAQISGRNDLEINGRKFSGSARTRLGAKSLLHGTLLINSDLGKLGALLTPTKNKIQSKGVASVRSRVCNLAEYLPHGFSMEELRNRLVEFCAPQAGVFPDEDHREAELLAEHKYRSWNWNFGASPPWNLELRKRFCWGEVVARFQIKKGRIANCRINGDFFGDRDVAPLERSFVGIELAAEGINALLDDAPLEDFFYGSNAEEVREFFLEATR